MRKQPGLPPKDINPKQNDKVITQVREYELITPLFGGGVTPAEADPVTIIRATEIRGQLRFWWRACRGGKPEFKGDPEKMKQQEDKIWGKAYEKKDTPPAQDETVQIRVEVVKRGESISYKDSSVPSYASFPLQSNPKPLQNLQKDVSFKLIISFPVNQKEEIEAALWAWETYGGIGARTRRGFGALRCTTLEENGQPMPVKLPVTNWEEAVQWMQINLEKYVSNSDWPENVPHLPTQLREKVNFRLIRVDDKGDVHAVWKDLIEPLKDFRQMRRPSPYGRSMWPEPSTIRHHTNQSHQDHANPIPNPPVYKFPRAAFGLPIIFQFKDSNKEEPSDSKSDPRKTVLQLEAYERLASPLILKPLACQEGEYMGLALILEGSGLDKEQLVLETQEEPKQKWNVEAPLDPGETLTLRYRMYQTQINSQTDILQEFLKFL